MQATLQFKCLIQRIIAHGPSALGLVRSRLWKRKVPVGPLVFKTTRCVFGYPRGNGALWYPPVYDFLLLVYFLALHNLAHLQPFVTRFVT
jgi:hypothetical protein